MPTTHDFVKTIAAKLFELEEAHTNQLILASADRHDKIAGIIGGLRLAARALGEEGKRWTMGDEE